MRASDRDASRRPVSRGVITPSATQDVPNGRASLSSSVSAFWIIFVFCFTLKIATVSALPGDDDPLALVAATGAALAAAAANVVDAVEPMMVASAAVVTVAAVTAQRKRGRPNKAETAARTAAEAEAAASQPNMLQTIISFISVPVRAHKKSEGRFQALGACPSCC